MTRRGIALFDGNIEGEVLFTQLDEEGRVLVTIDLYGLAPNSMHGFHIHEYGDMSDGCKSMGDHWNPYGKTHGSKKITGRNRHAGDLVNNVISDRRGEVHMSFEDELITLFGDDSIYGRGIILHSREDDAVYEGFPFNAESLKTGNAGKRLACAIIAVRK